MKDKKYFYIINYNSERNEELCNLEMKSIFGFVPEKKYVYTDIDTNPTRSPFIKEKINISITANTLEELIEKVKKERINLEEFKVIYLKSNDGDVDYNTRLKVVKNLGMNIQGTLELHKPKVIYAVTKIKEEWYFGLYEKNDFKWHEHDNKPYSYSNALPLETSRALINIAIGNDFKTTIVDPCCGIGTVVLEGLDIGVNIKGYEINKQIAANAKKNLNYYNFKNVIETKDMHEINEEFDVAILDLPYGLFTKCTEENQKDLILATLKVAKKIILVSTDDKDKILCAAGVKITDKCCIIKGGFKRFVTIGIIKQF
ncbi:MAG: SAM-dependent methyltransferase [Clostridiaceae bacterium]|nr:SAM-dependent methyltransferase [Clostridiaceae bacterium]